MSSLHTADSRNKGIAASGSVVFHVCAAILIILAMRGCGSGSDGVEYMALNIAALGDFEPGKGDPSETPVSASQPQPQEQTPETEETVETTDESPVTAPIPTKNPQPKPKPIDKPVEKPAEKPKQPSDALNDALNQLGKPGTSSGQSTSGGNEGAPDGQISGKGVFSGGGGSGEWSLSGRNLRSKPSLDERPTEAGKVVVDIWVDKAGNVTKAVANPAKSNTTSAQLYALAEKAARSARFSASEAAAQQKGTITIIFTLN